MTLLIKASIEDDYTEGDFDEAEKLLAASTYIVLDWETRKTDTFDGKLPLGCAVGIPYRSNFRTWYVNPEDLIKLWPTISSKELIMHNAKFDLQICEELGCEFDGIFWDTMIMAHLSSENEYSYELDHLGLMYFGHRKMMDITLFEKAFGGWHNIPFIAMGQYAMNDLHITWKLFLKYLGELQTKGLLDKVWPQCREYVQTLRLTQSEGLAIDWQLLDVLSDDAERRIGELESRLGFCPGKRNQLLHTLYGSPAEGALGLKAPSLTSKGAPSTDASSLETLQERHPEHKEFFADLREWRKTTKDVTSFYRPFRLRKTEQGYLHPGIKQHGTKTGRLSCAEPNLQQIPREYSRVKQLFKAKPGYVLIEADFSQIELRVGARYAASFGDNTMLDLYESGADVHHNTSELVGSYKAFADKKEGRQVGKECNFLLIYGGGAPRLHDQLTDKYRINCTVNQCYDWSNQFHKAYPGFKECIAYFEHVHKKNGRVEYWNGRRRTIREVAYGKVKHHIAFNSMVQGGCGQVLMYTMNRIQRANLRSKMCNTVHDSIWFYVPVDYVDEEIPKIVELMRYVPERVFKMPFGVDITYLDPREEA